MQKSSAETVARDFVGFIALWGSGLRMPLPRSKISLGEVVSITPADLGCASTAAKLPRHNMIKPTESFPCLHGKDLQQPIALTNRTWFQGLQGMISFPARPGKRDLEILDKGQGPGALWILPQAKCRMSYRSLDLFTLNRHARGYAAVLCDKCFCKCTRSSTLTTAVHSTTKAVSLGEPRTPPLA